MILDSHETHDWPHCVLCHDSSEALKYAGALDYVPDDNVEQIQKVKNSIVNALDRYRLQVRRRLNPENLRKAFDTALRKDKMTTFGFATGCFLGCVL
jgi:hypothetical protein